jgi:hypothetical protein
LGGSIDERETRPVGGEGEAPIQVRALFEPELLLQSTDQPALDDNRKHSEKIGLIRSSAPSKGAKHFMVPPRR